MDREEIGELLARRGAAPTARPGTLQRGSGIGETRGVRNVHPLAKAECQRAMPHVAGGERIDGAHPRRGRAALDRAVALQKSVRSERYANDAGYRCGDALKRRAHGIHSCRLDQTRLGEGEVGGAPREIEERFGWPDVAIENRGDAGGGGGREEPCSTCGPADIGEHRVEPGDAVQRQP